MRFAEPLRTGPLAALAASLLVAAFACSGGDSAPSPTASTPTPTVAAGALDAFRQFAGRLADAIAAKDPSFLATRATLVETICEGTETTGRCRGQPAGTRIQGIPGLAWPSNSSALLLPDEYTAMLSRYFDLGLGGQTDEFGDGSVRLYALAVLPTEGEPTFAAVVSSILDTYPTTGEKIGRTQREAHMFLFQQEGADWRFTGELVALSDGAETWVAGGCEQCYSYWERWQGGTP